MDSFEKRVIRGKRHLLASKVILDEDSVAELEDRGLFWDDIIEHIRVGLYTFWNS